VRRFGLVTPHLGEVQQRIVENYARAGFTCSAERHLGEHDNFAISEVGEATIVQMIRALAADPPDAVAVFCTNLRGAGLVAALEAEAGVPIYDTLATGLWQTRRIAGWGRLLAETG
jgi:maleate isomerase